MTLGISHFVPAQIETRKYGIWISLLTGIVFATTPQTLLAFISMTIAPANEVEGSRDFQK